MRLAAAAAALQLFAIGNDVDRLAAHADQIDVAAPNWYAVDGRGRVGGTVNPEYERVASSEGVEVWPVANARLGFRGGWLRRRPRAVARQVATVARRFDGVTLDIEEIPPSLRGRYSAFVADVARRARGSGVAVYAVRRTAAAPLRSAAGYDWRALSESADLVLAAGYGEHSRAGDPGPLTTAAGFDRVLSYATSISRRRVAPVLGGFGIAWPLFGGPAEIVSADGLPACCDHAIRGGAMVFYESASALRARKAAVRRAGMRWVALFSLGREPAGFW